MNTYQRIQYLKEQPETARTGIKWTFEENEELMKRINDGMSLEDIAKNHQRTITAVKSRVMMNALNIMKEKELSFEEVSKLVNISVDDLENYKQHQEEKQKQKEKQKEEKIDKKESDKLSLQQIIKLELEILEKQKKLELELKKLEMNKLELELKKIELKKS
jgi:hypothetical protein